MHEGINWKDASLAEIVEQLEFCKYQTADGFHILENNVAFVELKRRASEEDFEEDGD